MNQNILFIFFYEPDENESNIYSHSLTPYDHIGSKFSKINFLWLTMNFANFQLNTKNNSMIYIVKFKNYVLIIASCGEPVAHNVGEGGHAAAATHANKLPALVRPPGASRGWRSPAPASPPQPPRPSRAVGLVGGCPQGRQGRPGGGRCHRGGAAGLLPGPQRLGASGRCRLVLRDALWAMREVLHRLPRIVRRSMALPAHQVEGRRSCPGASYGREAAPQRTRLPAQDHLRTGRAGWAGPRGGGTA
jgi:hypothetical protein